MLVSHAQQFEDVMLWRALCDVRQGFYIDIGASDPCVESVSLLFYEQGWRGLHVEPSPGQAEALRLARPDETVIEAAVGDRSCDAAPMYECVSDAHKGLSTLDEAIRDVLRAKGIRTNTRPVLLLTLDDVFSRCDHPEVHWLKIDAEGYEKRIIDGWTCDRRPWLVVVESISPLENTSNFATWEPRLEAMGYAFVWTDRVNRFYVHENHARLAQRLTHAANVLDGFVLGGDAGFARPLERRRLSEVTALQRETAVLHQRVQMLAISNGALVDTCAGLEKDAAASRVEAGLLRARAEEAAAYAQTLRQNATALSRRCTRAEAENDRLAADVVAKSRERDRFATRYRELRRMHAELEADCRRLATGNSGLKRKLYAAETDSRALGELLSASEKRLVSAAATAEGLRDEIRWLRERESALESERSALAARFSDVSVNSASLASRLEVAEARVAALLASRSWRVTRPLRLVADVFRGIARAAASGKRLILLKDWLREKAPCLSQALRSNATVYKAYHRLAYGRWPPPVPTFGRADGALVVSVTAQPKEEPSRPRQDVQAPAFAIRDRLLAARARQGGRYSAVTGGTAARADFFQQRLRHAARTRRRQARAR